MENPKTIKTRLSVLRKAMSQHPKLFAQVADYLMILGQTKAATKVLSKGLKQFPDYPTGWIVKGNLHMILNEPEKARAAFKRSLELDPNIPYSHKRCRELATDKNDHVDIVRHLQHLSKIDPLEDNIQVMLQTHILRRIAVEKGIYSEIEVNRLMPGTLRETMIKHNLMPAELARYSRRWSVSKTGKPGDAATAERMYQEEIEEMEEIGEFDEDFIEPNGEEQPEDTADEEERYEDTEYQNEVSKTAPVVEIETEQEEEPTGSLERDWLGATPSEPSFEEEEVITQTEEEEAVEEEEEEEEVEEPRQRVSWADTVAGDVESSLVEVDTSEEFEEEIDDEKLTESTEPIEDPSVREYAENPPYIDTTPETEIKEPASDEESVRHTLHKLGFEEQPIFEPEAEESDPEEAHQEVEPNYLQEEETAALEPATGDAEEHDDTIPETAEDESEYSAPKPVLDLGSELFNDNEEDESLETSGEVEAIQEQEVTPDEDEIPEVASETFDFTPKSADTFSAESESEDEPVPTEPEPADLIPKEDGEKTADQDVVLKLLRNNKKQTEAVRPTINIERGAPTEFDNEQDEEAVSRIRIDRKTTKPELESFQNNIMESDTEKQEQEISTDDNTSQRQPESKPDLHDKARRELKEIASEVAPPVSKTDNKKESNEPKSKRIATKTLAELYASQGDWKRAVEVYEELLERHPSNTAYQQRLNDLKNRLEQSNED